MSIPATQIESLLGEALATEPLLAPHAAWAFELEGKLGEGGMGAVYAVRDKRNGRRAALKMLSKENLDDMARERFLREALLTIRLDHPGIPPVYEIGQTARGELFLLMRRIEGRGLDEEIASLHRSGVSSLGLRKLIQILIKIAETLSYAHSQGIIHRDLKPSNIMIGDLGEVLVLDWGIAKDASKKNYISGVDPLIASESCLKHALSIQELSQAGLTLSGSVLGTPGYMSPEQARGEDVDPRSDLYSLGLLLGEALGGQPLIAGESSLVRLIANVEGRHRQIEELSIHGPRPLLWILRRALHPDREERTSHADLFRDQLQAWLDDQPIPGYSYSLLEKAEGFIRRRPTLTLGWISALILILLSWQLWNAIIDLENRAQALRQAEGDEARAKAEAERARRIVDDLNEARSHAKKGLLRELEEKLTAALAESQRSESVLLSAAEIWKSVGSNAKSCELLEEAAKRFSPAFEALFERHRIEVNGQSGLQSSPWLSELIRRARELGLENEYTLYEDARNAFYQGDLQLALTMTNKALTFNRKLSMIFNLQAVICHKLQRPEEAQKNFDIAVELDPLFCGARINRGNFRMSFNQYSEAMTDYNKAIEIEGNNKEAYVNRGVLRKRAGDFAGARSDYDRAIELDPDFKEAFCNRAILLAQQTKDSASALADLDRALSLDPRFKDALFHRGKLQIQRGALSEALRDFDQALEVDGRQPFVLQERALLKLRQNDLRGACADFDVALEIDPELTLSLVNRGLTLERLGENQRALADFEAFLTRSPQHSSAAMIRQKIETLRQRGITSND